MDGFGDNFVPGDNSAPAADVDPAAEFLAREQDQLAGLEDELATPAVPEAAPAENEAAEPAAPAAEPVEDGNSGLLVGEGEDLPLSTPSNDLLSETQTEAESSHPQGDFSAIGSEFSTTGAEAPSQCFPESGGVSTPVPPPVREEPEKIRIWREEQEKLLKEKDAAEELAKEELRVKAKKELDDWYKQHEEQVAKTRQANRTAEKELVADTAKIEPGTEWERIAKLCDFNPKTSKSSRDISRMRSIILQVKQNPPIKA